MGFIYYIIKSFFSRKKNIENQINYKYKLFQRKFYKLTKINHIIPLSRARLGIYLFLKEIIKDNKTEVLLSPFTIFDVVNMVISAGGKPVFIDIKSKNNTNFLLDDLKKSINENTSCILLTHYHFNNGDLSEILELCKDKDIKLMEDCAISLGSIEKGEHVGYYSDASIFSFSIFKFISVYQGGALYVKDKKIRNKIIKEISTYKKFKIIEMYRYFLKGLKFSIVTSKFCFPFIFKIIFLGYKNDVKIIKDNIKNDPKPFLRKVISEDFLRKVNLFQIEEFTRQLDNLDYYQKIREKNFLTYNKKLKIYNNLSYYSQSFLNFPIVFSNFYYKKAFINHIMKQGFDVGEYYYRSCNLEKVFSKFKKNCPNSEHFSKCVVNLPTHHKIEEKYINQICLYIYDFLSKFPNSIIID